MLKIELFIFFLVLFASCCSQQTPVFDEANWLKRVNNAEPSMLYAPHQDEEGLFFNPWMPRSQEEQPRGKRFFFRKKMDFEEFPSELYGPIENTYEYLSDTVINNISFVGHGSLIVKLDGVTVLLDPFFSNRALVISKKIKIPFDFSKLPQHPVVLISHNHYDHLDAKTVKKLIKRDAVFIVPLGLREFFIKKGAKEVHELDWWQSVSLGPVRYTLVPAQHWSRRIGQKANTTLWGGFMIEASKTIYFSGDTGYFCGFRELGKKYNIDYAIISAGAYEPRWFMYYQHMNIEEFFRAADDLKAKTIIPMHFGTISLSDEPLVYPLHAIKLYLEENPHYAGKIKSLRVGEYISVQLKFDNSENTD